MVPYYRSFFPGTIRIWDGLLLPVISCKVLESFNGGGGGGGVCSPSDSSRPLLDSLSALHIAILVFIVLLSSVAPVKKMPF